MAKANSFRAFLSYHGLWFDVVFGASVWSGSADCLDNATQKKQREKANLICLENIRSQIFLDNYVTVYYNLNY